MANRRMIQKSLSVSKEFNSVSEFAQLLYLMITPHLDDFGKIDGDQDVIKALVLPMNKRSSKDIQLAIEELKKVNLFECYECNSQIIIKQPSFEYDQTGLNKRTKSRYPDPEICNSNNFQEIPRSSLLTEPKINEINLTKAKRIENTIIKSVDEILQNKILPTIPDKNITTRQQEAAYYAWKILEPENKDAFQTTYMNAIRRGVSPDLIRQFVSEILYDKTIKNRGKVFNSKVDNYCKIKEDDKS